MQLQDGTAHRGSRAAHVKWALEKMLRKASTFVLVTAVSDSAQ